jgi:glycosyltransferase involved in cell wall biosynthesis
MVNLTKGEGFGRPLLEFSCVNKPIITTNWSGPTDYLNPEFTTLLPGTLTNIHPSAANNMLLSEAQWFSVDMGQVGYYLKDIYKNYKTYLDKAKRQGYKSRTQFSYDIMKEKLDSVFKEHIPEFPKHVQIQLPKINKMELPTLKKIES